jgi:hypothetical protein
MDPVTLVEDQIEDGWSLLRRLEERGFTWRAACWVKPIDKHRWSLYIATPLVDQKGLREAYGEVIDVVRSLGRMSITSSDLDLVGEKHPVTQDVLNLLERFPGGTRVPLQVSFFGGMPVEEVYVYPNATVDVTIYSSFYPRQPGGSGVTFSLEPFSPDSWLQIGDNPERYPADTSQSWVIEAPEGSVLERDQHGQLVLVWNYRGKRVRSSAQELWSLARLGLQGFRFLKEPAKSHANAV